jgi:hypothetical protein
MVTADLGGDMADRIALKRLTASDLTVFADLFRAFNSSNQKAINLNADVLVDQLYPALPAAAELSGDTVTLETNIFGPGGAASYFIRRAITKGAGYKNWRLNGEFIHAPLGEPDRFKLLAPDDIAIMSFTGEPVPKSLSILLLANKSPGDAPIRAALDKYIPGGRRTMAAVTREQLAAASIDAPKGHPVSLFIVDPEFDAALEDAAQGGASGVAKLQRKATRKVDAATLAAAKASADKNGREGEALAWRFLQRQMKGGVWTSIEWASDGNAVAPYDFSAIGAAGEKILIDAKSTNGPFGRALHISVPELKAAASAERYDIWRVYELTDDGARLKIAKGISGFAKAILSGLNPPDGVSVDAVSVDPQILDWGAELVLEKTEDEPS